jgi:hypothetical protein
MSARLDSADSLLLTINHSKTDIDPDVLTTALGRCTNPLRGIGASGELAAAMFSVHHPRLRLKADEVER